VARAAAVEQPSRADRAARGKDARAVAPLDSHAEFRAGRSRDPVGLLLGQAQSRVPELVPVRHGRMLVSAFTFYRGAALPMAADLAGTPSPGLRVQLCGDAHLSNFGAFASPERRLVFDIEQAIGEVRSQVQAKRLKAGQKLLPKPTPATARRCCASWPPGRRATADHQRPADDHADRGGRGDDPLRPDRLRPAARIDLARAHARTGDRIALAAYLGGSATFDEAIADFAETYADQNERDYDSFQAAAKDGTVESATEI
jgi:hypothetical protein